MRHAKLRDLVETCWRSTSLLVICQQYHVPAKRKIPPEENFDSSVGNIESSIIRSSERVSFLVWLVERVLSRQQHNSLICIGNQLSSSIKLYQFPIRGVNEFFPSIIIRRGLSLNIHRILLLILSDTFFGMLLKRQPTLIIKNWWWRQTGFPTRFYRNQARNSIEKIARREES